MKKKDLIIMAHLRQNARISLTKLARKTNIPISTIFDRIKSNQNNLISRHVALLDFSKLGYTTRALVLLRITKPEKEKISDYLMKHESVNSLYKINNGFDFMLECIFHNIKELEEFTDLLDEKFKIKAKEVHYMIDDIKREAFLSDPQMIEMLFDVD